MAQRSRVVSIGAIVFAATAQRMISRIQSFKEMKYGRLLKGLIRVTPRDYTKAIKGDGVGFQTLESKQLMRIPRQAEGQHIEIMGDTGAGQTCLIFQLLLQIKERGQHPVWFVLDELVSLQRLPQLHTAITENRKSRNPLVLSFQGKAQLEVISPHLPLMAGRRGDGRRGSTENDASRGHPNNDESLW